MPNNSATTTCEYDLWGKTVNLGIPKDTFPSEDEIKEMEDRIPLDKASVEASHGWFPSSQNQEQLHYRKVVPANNKKPKAIIVYMHGISTHAGNSWIVKDKEGKERLLNFGLLVDRFVKTEGYALYAFDMLGHGYSEGMPRFYVPDWKVNRDDLESFCRLASDDFEGNIPFFVSGNSYGGTLALHVGKELQVKREAATEEKEEDGEVSEEEKAAAAAAAAKDLTFYNSFQGLLLMCPAIIGDLPPAPVTFTLRYILAPLMPTVSPFFMPNPVSPDRIWRDPAILKCNLEPRYVAMGLEAGGQAFALGTAVQMLNALDELRNVAIPALTATPFCVIHGTEDHAVPMIGTKFLEEHAGSQDERAVHYVDGAYHDLLGDPAAEEVMDHMVAFVKSRLTVSK